MATGSIVPIWMQPDRRTRWQKFKDRLLNREPTLQTTMVWTDWTIKL